MDDPAVAPQSLRQSLAFITRVNRWLGYTRTTLGYLQRFSRGWERGRPIQILDLATGSGDVPRAIAKWADRHGWDVRVVGVDHHPVTLDVAREQTTDTRIRYVRADVFALPFETGSFDYVISSMFLHHLDEDQAVTVLREMNRLARRGVIVADLLRHYRAYAWISLLTLLSSPIIRHDARASVAQAFTREEILMLRDRAGISWAKYYRHFGHRFVLAGEKVSR